MTLGGDGRARELVAAAFRRSVPAPRVASIRNNRPIRKVIDMRRGKSSVARLRVPLIAAIMALVLASWACGSERSDVAEPNDQPQAAQAEPASLHEDTDAADEVPVGEHSGNRQPGAEDMRVAVLSPIDGSTFSGNTIALRTDVNGFDLSCDGLGKNDRTGQGHLHVYLDDVLVNYFCTQAIDISMQNKEPGAHTLKVVPAQNSHTEIEENAETIELTWSPTSPPPVVQPANFGGEPSVQILDPQPDADITGGKTTVRLNVKSFNLSCDLMGKDGVEGYGHWHAHLATGEADQGHAGNLLKMGCSDAFELSTAGLEKGAIYTLVVQLTENGHAPIDGASDSIQFRVA